MSDASGKFEVSYGKPPKAHQFRQGTLGRPKEAKNKRKINTSFWFSAAEEYLKLYKAGATQQGDIARKHGFDM